MILSRQPYPAGLEHCAGGAVAAEPRTQPELSDTGGRQISAPAGRNRKQRNARPPGDRVKRW